MSTLAEEPEVEEKPEHETVVKQLPPWQRVVTFSALSVLLVVAIWNRKSIQGALLPALRFINEHRVPGVFVYIFLFLLCTLFLIPITPLTIAAGIVFPLWLAIPVVLLSCQIGLFSCILIARGRGRDMVQGWMEGDMKFKAIDRAVAREGWTLVFLLRLSPIIPFGLNNYLLALTAIPAPSLMFATLLGNIPGAVLHSFTGSIIGTLAEADEYEVDPKVTWFTILCSFVFLAGSAAFITTVARRALREALASSVDPSEGRPLIVGEDTDNIMLQSAGTDMSEADYTPEEKRFLKLTVVGLGLVFVVGLVIIFAFL
ncbi:snare associated Golgi protein-domain-containing protein [Cladochytrium replicatum]|nr:snare associated Golgi protein-domain-containing protein [Cladochytrium replicatum]